MLQTLRFLPVFLFIVSCSSTTEQKPDPDSVIKDTLAQSMGTGDNAAINEKNMLVHVQAKDKNITITQDLGVKNLITRMKPASQHFVINPEVHNEVTGLQGTRIMFESNSFVAKSGRKPTEVNIELKECFTLEDMLHENLSTSSNGKILQSKGMIYVSATSNGETLQLNGNRNMKVIFPFSNESVKGYAFFYGGDNSSAMAGLQPVNFRHLSSNDVVSDDAKAAGLQQPEFSHLGLSLTDYLTQRLNYPEEAKRNELSASVEVNLVIDRNGTAKVGWITSPYKIFKEEIENVVTSLPQWKPASLNGKNLRAVVRLNIDFNLRHKQQIAVSINEDQTKIVTNPTADLNSDDDLARLETIFAHSFAQMGWIACNRPLGEKTIVGDVVVRADSKTDVRIVLMRSNAVISGQNCIGYSRFQSLPINLEAYVVALRHENGNLYYSYKPITIAKQMVISLDWKKGTEEDIKKMFRSISVAV